MARALTVEGLSGLGIIAISLRNETPEDLKPFQVEALNASLLAEMTIKQVSSAALTPLAFPNVEINLNLLLPAR